MNFVKADVYAIIDRSGQHLLFGFRKGGSSLCAEEYFMLVLVSVTVFRGSWVGFTKVVTPHRTRALVHMASSNTGDAYSRLEAPLGARHVSETLTMETSERS